MLPTSIRRIALAHKPITAAAESRLPHGARVHPNGTLTLDGGPVAEPRQDRLKDFCELRKPAEHGELVSLLLQLTPKLARARFCLPRPASCKTLAQPDVSLTLLKWLAFDSLGDGFLLDQAVPMIRLAPNLEVLHCHDCVDVTSDLGRQTLDDRPPLQNLTELSLTNSDLTAVSLSNLLSAVGPRLCKVRIQPRSRGVSTHVGDDIKFDEALAVLQPWNQTLKELSFCLYGIQHPRLLRGVGVLREFHALQTLQAESAFFDFYSRRDALTSTLPPSIRELRLLGYSNLVPALQGLLEDFLAGRFPELSRIEIDDQEYESESLVAQELRQVETAFLSAGVDFIVHDQPEETENESSVSSV